MRVAACLLLVLIPLLALAEEPAVRQITVPRLGLSFEVPATWTVEPQGQETLSLEGPAGVSLVVYDRAAIGGSKVTGSKEVPGANLTVQEHTAPDTGAWSWTGTQDAEGRPFFRVTARATDDAGREAALGVLETLDARPFPNPRIHADWRRGWTIEVPKAWLLQPKDGTARFVSPDGSCTLAVDAWEDVPEAKTPPEGGLDGWIRLAIRLALEAGIDGKPIVAHDEAQVAEIGIGAGIDARLSGFWVQTEAQKTGPQGWISVLASERFRMVLTCREQGTPAAKAGLDAFPTFEPDTLAALRPRADDPAGDAPAREAPAEGAAPTDRFDRAGAPAVAFTKPATWKASPGTNEMRLLQYEVPGDPPAEIVVFFFGAGGGGGVEANLDRWKGMMHGDEPAKTSAVEVAEGIRVHLLDAKGTYVASGMGGSGTPVHIADARMLAAVIECPGGPLFVRGVGPEKAMDAAEKDFVAWVKSFRAVP